LPSGDPIHENNNKMTIMSSLTVNDHSYRYQKPSPINFHKNQFYQFSSISEGNNNN
jgi:hypothetical protein